VPGGIFKSAPAPAAPAARATRKYTDEEIRKFSEFNPPLTVSQRIKFVIDELGQTEEVANRAILSTQQQKQAQSNKKNYGEKASLLKAKTTNAPLKKAANANVANWNSNPLFNSSNATTSQFKKGLNNDQSTTAAARNLSDDNIQYVDLKPLTDTSAQITIPTDAITPEKAYVDNNKGTWNRYNLSSYASGAAKFFNMAMASTLLRKSNSDNGSMGSDRLVVILPETTERIIILPNVNGKLEIFMRCLEMINKYLPMPNYVLVFSPKFFGQDVEINKKLLAKFIEIKNGDKTAASLYIIAENTVSRQKIAYNAQQNRDPTFPVIAMYEPTYILSPFKFNTYGGILITGAAYNEVDLPLSRSKQAGSTFQFLSSKQHSELSQEAKPSFFAFPPNISVVDPIVNRYKVFRFSNEPETDKLIKVYLKGMDEHDEVVEDMFTYNQFLSTDNEEFLAVNTVDPYTKISLLGNIFSIRFPLDKVKQNWKDLKFTDDEANFLDQLGISPIMIGKIFGGGVEDPDDIFRIVGDELANFLEGIIRSKCFTDSALITNNECTKSAEFLSKIRDYLLKYDSRKSFKDVQTRSRNEDEDGKDDDDDDNNRVEKKKAPPPAKEVPNPYDTLKLDGENFDKDMPLLIKAKKDDIGDVNALKQDMENFRFLSSAMWFRDIYVWFAGVVSVARLYLPLNETEKVKDDPDAESKRASILQSVLSDIKDLWPKTFYDSLESVNAEHGAAAPAAAPGSTIGQNRSFAFSPAYLEEWE
jgi:hypothetical protein